MVEKRLLTYADGFWEKHNGFFEYIPADGLYVDLTQPSLLSHQQITHIFQNRGFVSLLSTVGTDRESLIKAYVKYVQPLPCRDHQSTSKSLSTEKLSNRRQFQAYQSTASTVHRSHLNSSPNISKKPKECDLDSLVIIHNPDWPTSGEAPVESKVNENGKRSVPHAEPHSPKIPSSTSSPSQPPPKRPKINRNFEGLEQLLRKNKFPS
nr:expressed conserved protein [Hymenolepis microstoma]